MSKSRRFLPKPVVPVPGRAVDPRDLPLPLRPWAARIAGIGYGPGGVSVNLAAGWGCDETHSVIEDDAATAAVVVAGATRCALEPDGTYACDRPGVRRHVPVADGCLQGTTVHGVEYYRNKDGHLCLGRTGSGVNHLACVRMAGGWRVRLKPASSTAGLADLVDNEWVPARETASALLELRADPSFVLDALLDSFAEAWDVLSTVGR